MTPFKKVHHICIAVHDIERASEYYESVGIGPWQDYGSLAQYSDLEVPDVDGFFASVYRTAQVGDLQLQLVQPGAGSPQRRFLDEHGEGIFHIGFEVGDIDESEAQAAALRMEVLMRGRRPDGSGFAYFDTADRAGGVVLELRSTSAPASS
ncbi:VOC family protein [Conexibacter woesei]|uniref:Glyoxalase/bleomycin resistance protein/dioxygenase n=1 Tax=Conexibacter woesei (strain DSM 14684 / CCUG 47730 / CIP 108061 / JCM 11494 / NBRC 100937 / ID131577) TaxID=469383 RepID=D3F3L5_CONWI|nr:VOC family protein [Conexibacter woesei]ADB52380.1 Glyoxalase/bleomycin resistance protein/dioxygenase [Conexibacter woesei DSM 14684]